MPFNEKAIFIVLAIAYSTGIFTNPLNALLLRSENSKVVLMINLLQLFMVYAISYFMAHSSNIYVAVAILSAHLLSLFISYLYIELKHVETFKKITSLIKST